jgi:hypothetical protein
VHFEYFAALWSVRQHILPIHSLFKDFVAVLKEYGSEEQLCYLKKKMNVLRSRITVDISLY